jgi:nitroimidazol reductase NimA-like FMN-containing flavoprotein (pyridoxamine 5'-phosphate oxidase superfamily)
MSETRAHELCRLATASKDAVPQVTPVCYAMDGDNVVITTDYGTRKLKNLRENNVASLLVGDYNPSKALLIEGSVTIHEKGEEYLRLLKILFDRFEKYKKPRKTVSWGL